MAGFAACDWETLVLVLPRHVRIGRNSNLEIWSTKGVFHLTVDSKHLEMETSGTEIAWDNLKLIKFPQSEPINRKFWNSRRKIKWKANSENLGVAWEVLFFYGNSGNCPLASIRHWKFPWNSKKNFSLTEKRLLFLNFKTVWFFRGFRLWDVFFYTLT